MPSDHSVLGAENHRENSQVYDPLCPNVPCDCRDYLATDRHSPECKVLCLCPLLREARTEGREEVFREIEELSVDRELFKPRTSYDIEDRRRIVEKITPQDILERLLVALRARDTPK